ncbi:MAG TPA: type II secretion system protein GspE, partial [Firmicutes bacterium]|nr:type II secretion system protein GspE [Bacillota bacterium]
MAYVEKKRLGDLLVSAGKITPQQLQEALTKQRVLGKKIGEILVESQIITEENIIDAIETQTGIKKVDLNTIDFDKKAIHALSQNLCEKYMIVPFAIDTQKICVAMEDP